RWYTFARNRWYTFARNRWYTFARNYWYTLLRNKWYSLGRNIHVSIEKTEFKLEILEKQDKDSCIRYIRVYFDLCSEQHFLFKTKRIDQDIWKEWEEGMKHFFSIPAFKIIWQEYYSDSEYFNDFKSFVERELV
ncbi:MAG: hypothetical protein KA096_01390, partial [Bacteroidales bacterium]|nr:hypothetical protein [Bacteroidales bacterium]